METNYVEEKQFKQGSTRAVHGGTQREKAFESLTTPIVETATYTFANSAELIEFMESKVWGDGTERLEYARYGNPTVSAVEARIAALEGNGEVDGGVDSLLYSSGMAALTSLMLSVLSSGTHVVITDDCYRRTHKFVTGFLTRFGVETTVVPMGDYEALANACIPKKTRLIVSESPTNPYLRVLDLERINEIAKANKTLTLIDSTFATPINQQPLAWGVDFVVHSATKYLSGHNDILAGVVSGRPDRIAAVRQFRGTLGGVINPQTAFMLERGLKTLGVRINQQNRSAQRLAEYLEHHPRVVEVSYPGLASHLDHAIATRQMSGYGGVVTFRVDGDFEATTRFIDRLDIPYIAASLGGVESLVEQPALMSYYEMPQDQRESLGMYDNLVRYAVGIEDVEDLIADVEQALADTL